MNSLKNVVARLASYLRINPRSSPSNFRRSQKEDSSPILLIDSDGLSHYTCYFACGLSKYREVILCGFSRESYEVTGAAKQKRIRFHCVGEKLPQGALPLKIVWQTFFLFFILFKVLTKTKYDIVHIQGHLPTFFLFVPMLRCRKKQIFWTIHDVRLLPSYKGIKGELEILYVRTTTQPNILSKYSHSIIVHASILKKELASKGINQNKIHVIPHFDYGYLIGSNNNDTTNSNNDSTSENEHRKSNNIMLFADYVLFFGHVTPNKGIDVLIRASQIVRKQVEHHKLNVLVAGKGDSSYYEDLLTKEDYDYIHILNKYITSNEIPELLSKAAFLVLPYTKAFQYTASGVIPLAYTFSKPVIISDVPSLAEYVDHGKTGFIFEAGNSSQLANYIIELLENKNKCIEMGKNAYQKMLQEMSLERCCKLLNDLYEKRH